MTALPFIRYARVSRVGGREGEGFISVPEQIKTMDHVAADRGVDVLPDVLRDMNKSGGDLDREQYQHALELVRSGTAGGIIVATYDRVSRDAEDALATVREIESYGGRVLCGDGDVTLSNGADKMMAGFRALVSAFERDRRTEYLDKSVRNAIERGVHLSAPFGYVKSNGKGSRLAVHPVEAPTVLAMFEARAAGHSWPAIAKTANASGVMPRPFKRHGVIQQGRWTHKTVRQIVLNEVYTGVAFNGRHRHEHAHDAIVTPELFAAANRARGTKPIGPAEGYLATGLVRCSQCGHTMIHQQEGKRRYFRCRSAQSGACPGTSVPAVAIEELLADELRTRFLSVPEVAMDSTDARVIEADAAAEQSKARLAAMIELFGGLGDLGATERELFDGRFAAERQTLADAEREQSATRMASVGATLPGDLDADAFESMPVPERRRLLGLVFAAVVVRPAAVWREPVSDRRQIVGREEAPTDSTGLIAYAAGLDW